jgi:hypothetical protein
MMPLRKPLKRYERLSRNNNCLDDRREAAVHRSLSPIIPTLIALAMLLHKALDAHQGLFELVIGGAVGAAHIVLAGGSE